MSGKERIICKTFHYHKIQITFEYLNTLITSSLKINSPWQGKDFITAIEIQRLVIFLHKLFPGEGYGLP